MRLLHIGWGFRPWRTGGLIAYTEDVMRFQARSGHDVAYFFAGRHLPGRDPHLRRWQRDGVTMFELWNGPVTVGVGTRAPERDLAEPASEAAFRAILDRWAPDVVHVQELLGLPSSLLVIPHERDIPVVLSLEDYQILCPTLKLFDSDGRNCRRRQPGAMCRQCSAHSPADNRYLVRRTIEHSFLPGGERATMVANNVVNAIRWSPVVRPLRERRRVPDAAAPPVPAASATAFDRRRDVNLERMGQVDAVLAMSHGVADVCRDLGVAEDRLEVLHFTLAHLAGIRPSPRVAPQAPMTFVALNACLNTEKGLDVVLRALECLDERGLGDRYRIQIWGFVHPPARPALEAHRAVQLRGNYTNADLERILEQADVGILPSVWEEAYAYVGVEMLAGGVPVIGNARGGITDYVRPGDTGWLNRSATGEELAEHMRRLIANPAEVQARRRDLRTTRPAAIKPMEAHLDELSAVYERVRSRSRPSRIERVDPATGSA